MSIAVPWNLSVASLKGSTLNVSVSTSSELSCVKKNVAPWIIKNSKSSNVRTNTPSVVFSSSELLSAKIITPEPKLSNSSSPSWSRGPSPSMSSPFISSPSPMSSSSSWFAATMSKSSSSKSPFMLVSMYRPIAPAYGPIALSVSKVAVITIELSFTFKAGSVFGKSVPYDPPSCRVKM